MILFIWLILHQKWDVVLTRAAGIAIWALFLAVGFYLLSYGFNTLRWCILLWAQGVAITYWNAYRLNWAGVFASNFLPSTIGGDGFRMLAVHRYARSTTISVGSVLLDRMINMAAMACLIPIPISIFGTLQLLRDQFSPKASSPSNQLVGLKRVWQRYVPARLAMAFIPSGFHNLIGKYFPKIGSAFRLWASKPWTFVYAFLAAWPSNLFPMAATYLLARQLGMPVTFWQVVGMQTVTYFLSLLPISVNGYGLREVAFTTLYTALGSTIEQASTLALATRFLMVLTTLPGAIWLNSALTGVTALDKDPQP